MQSLLSYILVAVLALCLVDYATAQWGMMGMGRGYGGYGMRGYGMGRYGMGGYGMRGMGYGGYPGMYGMYGR